MKVLILVLCALAATSIQAGKLQDIIGKVKTEFEHLKEIAALIKGGAKPIDVLKEVLKDHPGLKPKLQKACESKLAKLIPGAQAACDAINQPEPAPVDQVITAPVDVSKRGLQDVFGKVIAELKEKLNGLLQVIGVKPKPAVDVSKRGLQDIFGKVVSDLKEKLNSLLQLVGIKKPSADAPAVSKRGIQDVFGKIVGEIKEKFESLLEKLNLKPKPAAGTPTVSKRDIQAIFGKIVGELKEKFESLLEKLNLKPKAKRGITDLASGLFQKLKQEIDHLKQIAAQITQGKSPAQFIKDLAKKGYLKALTAACKLSPVQHLFSKACKAVEAAPAPAPEPAPAPAPAPEPVPAPAPAPVDDTIAVPAPAQRGFGSFLNNIAAINPFAKEVEGVKKIVELIKQKKSAGEIIQAIVDLGLQSKIVGLCQNPLFSKLPVVGEACTFIAPLADQIAAFSG